MTLWSHLYCLGYGLHARAEALAHKLRGHDVRWRGDCVDWWCGHTGCITCEACPDSTFEDGAHVGVVFWCRDNPLLRWLGQAVCGWKGHGERRHPQRGTGEGWEDVLDEWYCYRCGADVSGSATSRT